MTVSLPKPAKALSARRTPVKITANMSTEGDHVSGYTIPREEQDRPTRMARQIPMSGTMGSRIYNDVEETFESQAEVAEPFSISDRRQQIVDADRHESRRRVRDSVGRMMRSRSRSTPQV